MMTEVSPKPIARKTKSGIVVPHAPRWYQRWGALLIYLAIQAYVKTLRMRWDSRSRFSLEELNGPVIGCLWHNRLLLCMEAYQHRRQHQDLGKGLAALISASKDGA